MATAYELCAGDEAARDEGVRQAVRDETPMVRRAAARHLGAFASKCDAKHVETEMLALFRRLTNDEQDSVRLLVVEDCAKLGRLLPKRRVVGRCRAGGEKFAPIRAGGCATWWRSSCTSCVRPSGKIWRARSCSRATSSCSRITRRRCASRARGVSELCQLVGPEAATAEIVPRVKDLAGDTSQHVRAALASEIMGLAPTLGKDLTIDHLLPVFLTLLKDEIPEVRLNIISKLDQVNSVIGVDLLSQELLPAIKDLAEDAHWRVRLAIIEYVPLLASQMGTAFLFQKNGDTGEDGELTKLCLRWLGDRVHSIREAAAVNLQRLTEVFGEEWARGARHPARHGARATTRTTCTGPRSCAS